MGAVKLAENVYWVGAIDYDIRDFHGYRTPFGTTYNAYLVIDEKITLIDSVKSNFADVMLSNIAEIINPERIDYVVSNHVEPDHSGSLPNILEIVPNAVVFTSPNGEKGLRAYYKKDWNFKVVKTGDSVNTGKFNLSFLLTPMVHWPDNMGTYLDGLNILFSNDAFGQHVASDGRFDDEIGIECALDRAKDYYANIVLPFGQQVKKVLAESCKFDIRMIAPSHGICWRSAIGEVIGKYTTWADNKTDENLAVIVYDTMWGSTEILAKRIADDFEKKGISSKILSLKKSHISEVMAELIEAKYICVGSPTLNRNLMPNVAAFLAYMKGLSPKKRTGLAFGSYGWSGESVDLVEDTLKSCGFEMLDQIKVQYRP